MRNPELERQLDDAKRAALPKSLNLHAMKVNQLDWNSDPEYITFDDGIPRICRTHDTTKWVLEDVANGFEVTIVVRKTKPVKIDD